MLAVYTLLSLDVSVMSWLLANSLQSRYFKVQQGGLFLGFMGVISIPQAKDLSALTLTYKLR
jgi:hypothetical protein